MWGGWLFFATAALESLRLRKREVTFLQFLSTSSERSERLWKRCFRVYGKDDRMIGDRMMGDGPDNVFFLIANSLNMKK